MATAYIAHIFTLARINSETVRNGIPCILMTVDVSKRRGPPSPAGRISISIGADQIIQLTAVRGTYLDRRCQMRVGDMQTGQLPGQSSRARQCDRPAHRSVQGECAMVRCSLPATASRTCRNG
jgi:hypothetical protein